MEDTLARDFLYLDAEALRSFTAQLLGGIAETRVQESEHSAGATGKAEAGLLNFVKASGEADYRYRRSGSETQSLHHQIYTRFERALFERDAIELVDREFDFAGNWTVDHFADGSFVKVRGRIQFTDYSRTLLAIEGFPKLLKAFNAIQMINIKNAADAAEITPEVATAQRKELTENENAVKKIPVEGIVALGRNLYAEGQVRVKVHPTGAPEQFVLVGQGQLDSLLGQLGSEGLIQTPDSAEWVAVGQIAAGVATTTLRPILTGNVLEDSVQQVGTALRELVKTGNAATFPTFEFRPLAIYRELRARSALFT